MKNRIKGFFNRLDNKRKQGPVSANRVIGFFKTKGGKKMESRFDVIKLDREASQAKKAAKAKFVELEGLIKNSFPAGVSRTQAILKLEEAYQWVSKAARVATESRA